MQACLLSRASGIMLTSLSLSRRPTLACAPSDDLGAYFRTTVRLVLALKVRTVSSTSTTQSYDHPAPNTLFSHHQGAGVPDETDR